MEIQVQDGEGNPDEVAAKQEFIIFMTCGGLIEPTELLFNTCIYATAMFDGVMKKEQSSQVLLNCLNPQGIFMEALKIKLKEKSETAALITVRCQNNLEEEPNGVKKVLYSKI